MKFSYLLKALLAASMILTGCDKFTRHDAETAALTTKVEKLQHDLDAVKQDTSKLKPDLAAIMSTIETHYSKLMLSGLNQNWDLAQYQVDKIKSEIGDATGFYGNLKVAVESVQKMQSMSVPELTELESAIREKSESKFLANFKRLTTSCNLCHQAAGYGYIIVQPPQDLMFSNQDFRKRK